MKVKSPLKEKFNIPRQDHKTTFNFVSFFILKFWRTEITHVINFFFLLQESCVTLSSNYFTRDQIGQI